MPENNRIYVLGMGNILCGDDGFGCHAIARLQEKYCFNPNINLIDAGTQGQLLPGILASAHKLLILDAADFDEMPGSVFERNNSQIPQWLGMAKLSAHQGSLAEALALARLQGKMPEEICFIGFQPVKIEFGVPISAACETALQNALSLAFRRLHAWGCRTSINTTKTATQIHPALRRAFACRPDN